MQSKRSGNLGVVESVQEYKSTRVKEYNNTLVQEYISTLVRQYTNTKVHQHTITPVHTLILRVQSKVAQKHNGKKIPLGNWKYGLYDKRQLFFEEISVKVWALKNLTI